MTAPDEPAVSHCPDCGAEVPDPADALCEECDALCDCGEEKEPGNELNCAECQRIAEEDDAWLRSWANQQRG
jgi:hypothetical protein